MTAMTIETVCPSCGNNICQIEGYGHYDQICISCECGERWEEIDVTPANPVTQQRIQVYDPKHKSA